MSPKKIISILALSITPFLLLEEAAAETLLHKDDNSGWALGISGGALLPATGSYDSRHSSSSLLQTGPFMAATLSKKIGNRFRTEISAGAGWLEFGSPVYEGSSNFSLAALVLGNSYSVIDAGRFEFSLRGGAGIYFWRVCREKVFGGARQFEGEDLQKASIGFRAGLGGSYLISRRISVDAQSNYNYILCRDSFHFGSGFTEQGIVDINLGIGVYLF